LGRTGESNEAVDLIKGEKRRFHQGPRVTTLNFEAGYMLAVFSKMSSAEVLQHGPGPYMTPLKPSEMEYDFGRTKGEGG
jgi:hypothetical protein